MRKTHKWMMVAVVLALGVGTVAAVQMRDLASELTETSLIAPGLYANSATTSAWYDAANHTALAFVVNVGLVQNSDTIYLALQDSSSGLAVATFDSVMVGVAQESTTVDRGYLRNRRYVRAVLRASGAGSDSNAVSAIVLGTKRSR